MSMSAQEVLLNCKKQFEFIKKDITAVLAYIQEAIDHCKQIDNSNFYSEKLKELEIRVKKELLDLKTADDYANELELEAHLKIQKYREIQRFIENKRKNIAKFKTEVFALKKDVVKKEQESIFLKLNTSSFDDYVTLKDKIINLYSNIDDKAIVKKFLLENEVLFLNKNYDEVVSNVNIFMTNKKQSTNYVMTDMINKSIKFYDDDPEMVTMLQDNIKMFEANTKDNERNLLNKINDFWHDSSKNIENEVVRKDCVVKIVKAIRDVGYIVKEDNIRKNKEKNLILIYGEKISGESASFAVRLDGSYVYNYEGFQGKEHDHDADQFLKKLYENGIQSTNSLKRQYREPKYIAKQKNQILNKKNKKNE